MAIDINNDKKKFVQNLYAENDIQLSDVELDEILANEDELARINPETYDFETSVAHNLNKKQKESPVAHNLNTKPTESPIGKITLPEDKVVIAGEKTTGTLTKEDFNLDETSFLEKAKKLYPDFKISPAKFGENAIRVTNQQGKSTVINLNTPTAISSGDAQLDKDNVSQIGNNPTAFQQFDKFIKESESISNPQQSYIFETTGLGEHEYYRLKNTAGGSSKPNLSKKEYTNHMFHLVDKIEEITHSVVSNPGKYIKSLPEDMDMFDTEWLSEGNNLDLVQDAIYESVLRNTSFLGGELDESSFNEIMSRNPEFDATSSSLLHSVIETQAAQEKRERAKQILLEGEVNDDRLNLESSAQYKNRGYKEKRKIQLVSEIRELAKELEEATTIEEKNDILQQIKEKEKKIKRNATSTFVSYHGGNPDETIINKDLASTFYEMYDDPDDAEAAMNDAGIFLSEDLDPLLAAIYQSNNLKTMSRYEALTELRKDKIAEFDYLLKMGDEKKIEIDIDKMEGTQWSKIRRHIKGFKESDVKDGKVSVSYDDIYAMRTNGVAYHSYFKNAVSKEDYNWMELHKSALQRNKGQRYVLYDVAEVNRDPGEINKPGFILNFAQTAISSTLQEIFGYTAYEAGKVATLNKRGRDDAFLQAFSGLVDEYNENYAGKDGVEPIKLTKKQIKNLTKTLSEEVAEGLGHFVPVIIKLRTIGFAMDPLLKITQVANRVLKMTQSKSLSTRLEGHFINSMFEEVRMNLADMGTGTGTIFYGMNVAGGKMKLNAMWNPIYQKIVKQGVTGMSASDMSQIFEEGILNKNKDFKSAWNELYGEYSDFEKRMLVSLFNFKLLGATHVKPIDLPWNRTVEGLARLHVRLKQNQSNVIKDFEKDIEDGKVNPDEFILGFEKFIASGETGVEKYTPARLLAIGKAPYRYQKLYDAYSTAAKTANIAFNETTKAYELDPEHKNFKSNVQKRLVDPYNKALREVLGKDFEDIKVEFTENPQKLGGGNVAEYNTQMNTITVLKGKFNVELFNHEITHAMLSNYFKFNPEFQLNFSRSFATQLGKLNFEFEDPNTGEKTTIKKFVRQNYGDMGKFLDLRGKEAKIKFNNEFLSYTMQLLTRSKVRQQAGVLYGLEKMFADLGKTLGLKGDAKSTENLLNAMAKLSYASYGKVNVKDIVGFVDAMKNTNVIIHSEGKGITPEKIKETFYNAKDVETGTREVNDFVNNQFRQVDWKNMSREQKIEFGEVMGMYYEPVIKGYLKKRFPDLKQQQIEDIATEFMGSKPGGFAKMVAAFDINKNKGELTGFFWNEKQIPVKIHKFLENLTKLKFTVDKTAFGEGKTTLGETIEGTAGNVGKIETKSNKVDPRTIIDPKDVIKIEDIVKDKNIKHEDPKTMYKNYGDITIEFANKAFGVTAKGKNAYSQADVNNVIAKLNEKVEHNGKKITVAELIFNGMSQSNVNPLTGKAMGVAEIMQRYLMGDPLGRASGSLGRSRQGTAVKTMKTWEEVGGIEGINKIFEQLKLKGKRGEQTFSRGWVEQYNRLLSNTVVRRKAKLEEVEAEVLEQMAGGYINLAAKDISEVWGKVSGMTEPKVLGYITEYSKDQEKFRNKYSEEIVDMVEGIAQATAYTKFMSGKTNAAHYDLSKIEYKDITLKDGTTIKGTDIEKISNNVSYITRKLTRDDGKTILEVDVDKVTEYIERSGEIVQYLPKGMPIGMVDGLLGLHLRTTGLNKRKKGKGFNQLVSSETKENFKKIEDWMNPTDVYNNIGKKSTLEFSKKDLKSLNALTNAYKDALKLREKGKNEEADLLLENKFSQLNEELKKDIYYYWNKSKQEWLESAKTKKEYLIRAQHIMTMGKLQDNVRMGERALVPIHAVYLPGGPMKGVVKLEHVESMVERSLETSKAIIEGRFINEGRKLIGTFKGVLGEAETFNIVDLVGGRTNVSGMARFTAEMEKLKDYYMVGKKGIENTTLYDKLMFETAQSLNKNVRDLNLPYLKDVLYKYAASKSASDKIILEKAIKANKEGKKWASVHASHVKAVIKSGLKADPNMSTSQLAELLNLKVEAAQIYLNPNAKKSGASVYDLDRTLYEGVEQVTVTMPNGKKLRLNSEEFAKEYETLQKEGGEFDYSQFDKILGNKKGPLFDHLLKQQEQHGNQHLYVLTARAPGATRAIRDWLKRNGVDMPVENIVTLQDGRPEAKANWFVGKIVEKGYNDMFFTDDVKNNVNAVGKVLDNLGINSKLKEANIQAAKDLSGDFNKMLEETTGVKAFKIFSAATARKRGKDIGRWRWWLPPGAQHFLTLNYKFFGKGAKGDKHREWFDKVLAEPYAKAQHQLNIDRTRLRTDYKELLKTYPEIRKLLNKDIKYNDYTHEHAARVYLWDKMGVDMTNHGLTKTDRTKLINFVNKNPELKAFADQLSIIAATKEGYIKPSKNWVEGNIAEDVRGIGHTVYRKELFKVWTENKNAIFTEENLQKIESIYGTRYRESLEDILHRMEHDTSRNIGKGDRDVSAADKWTAGATATVMFLNRKSALTQTVSTFNFIEGVGKPNNPLSAIAAFAGNPKQFWKDFAYIFNSPMLKQRRLGNKLDVNYAELSEMSKNKKDPITAASSWLLDKGFIFTKGADSFAIAAGGAAYYRNYVNHFLKQGLSKKQAEEKAFIKFQEASDIAQQSTRPDIISKQQASSIGRYALNFQNVSIQNNNNMYRAILDLTNKRGDTQTNINKIIYYGLVQNVMFLGLQQAVFTAYYDPDEKEISKKAVDIGNGMLDILLRGSGLTGAVISTLKNTLIEYVDQTQKGYKGDQAKVLIQALNFSPPIGSKSRKFYSALQEDKFNKESTFKPPLLAAEAVTNIPFHEFYEMIEDGETLSKQEVENWQKLAIILGYKPWQIGIEQENTKKKKDISSEVKIGDAKMQEVKIN